MSTVAASLLRFMCNACSYGVSVVRPPSRCPMCGGHVWRPQR